MEHTQSQFPVTLEIDYPEKPLDRLTTFFRPIVAIPILIVLALVSDPSSLNWGPIFAGGVLFLPTLLMILFRKKYPRWWFDWNVALVKFSARCSAYLTLLHDEYPSTDEEQAVHIAIPYPDVQRELNPGMPLVKWFLAIPHFIVLSLLGVGVVVCVIVAWFAILFTGVYPRPIFDFVVGAFRWSLRVSAYAILLTTDIYPPFSLTR